jgi:hypothetical protein
VFFFRKCAVERVRKIEQTGELLGGAVVETQSIRLLVLLAGALCFTAQGQNPQTVSSAVVKGQVLNLEGLPVPHAIVTANIVPSREGNVPSTLADEAGKFSLQLERTGKYLISARQEEEGYPDRSLTAYGPPAVPLPEVVIEEGLVEQSVTIYLGPKAGKLAAQVFNAETNQPIENGQIDLIQRNADRFTFGQQRSFANGGFQLLAPAGPFTFKVSAPGYRQWYGDGRSKQQPVVFLIGPGDTHEITILLEAANE